MNATSTLLKLSSSFEIRCIKFRDNKASLQILPRRRVDDYNLYLGNNLQKMYYSARLPEVVNLAVAQ